MFIFLNKLNFPQPDGDVFPIVALWHPKINIWVVLFTFTDMLSYSLEIENENEEEGADQCEIEVLLEGYFRTSHGDRSQSSAMGL